MKGKKENLKFKAEGCVPALSPLYEYTLVDTSGSFPVWCTIKSVTELTKPQLEEKLLRFKQLATKM